MPNLTIGLKLFSYASLKPDSSGGTVLPDPVSKYIADASYLTLDGNLISQWSDSVGNNDLTQNAIPNQPSFINNEVEFDNNAFMLGLPEQTGDFTYVMKGVSFDVTSVKVLIRNVAGAGDIRINSNGTARVINNDGQAMLTTTGNLFSGSSLILAKEGSNMAFYFDGIRVADTNSVTGTFLMGKLGNQANSIQGTISEYVAVYDQALNDDQVASLNGLTKMYLLDEDGNNLVDEFGNNLFSYG